MTHEVTYYIQGLFRQGNAALARDYLEISTVTGAGITQLTGDVTSGPGSGSQAATIPNDTITYAKMQNVTAASRLLGRGSAAGAGDVQEITLGSNLSMTGTVLDATGGGITQLTGDVTAGPGSGSQAATIPNDTVTYGKMQNVSAASKLLGRGDSGSGDPQEITLGTNLSITGTTLNATAGGSGTVTNTGTLTDHALIVGNGGVDVSALSSLGTTTTLLHGNASGDPTYGPVVEADITLADNTTNNSSAAQHGFLPKLSGTSTQYLDGNGGWSTPSGTDYFWDTIESSIMPAGGTTSTPLNCERTESTATKITATGAVPPLLNYATTASVGNIVSVGSSNVDQFPYFQEIRYDGWFSIQENTAVRGFCGMSNVASATMGASDLPAGKYAMFRFSTNAADTNWMCCTNNNTSSEAISSGVPFVAGQLYRFKITWDGSTTGKVKFYIDGTLVHTSTMDLGSTDLFAFRVQLTTLANTTKNCRCGGQKIRVYYF